MKKKMTAIMLSYILIVIDIIVGIVFVPFLKNGLGDVDYGLYKLLLSTASYLSVLDFGIGGTITRYVVKFKTEKDQKNEENFLAMGFTIYAVLSLLVIIAAIVISLLIPSIYAKSIDSSNMKNAQTIFLILCSTTAISLFNHAYNGLLVAYEKHIFNQLTNILKIVLRVCLIVSCFFWIKNIYVVVLIDFALAALLLLTNIIYTHGKLKIRIKLYKWDKLLAKEALIFTSAILLQSIINQINSNVDNMVLGIYSDTTAIVTIYSLALQLYTMYSSLSTSISTIYLPSISKAVFNGESDEQITHRVVEPSRLQLIILMLALTGFILFGKDFINLWVGEGYEEVYWLAFILLFSSSLELSQNTITSVLKAKKILLGKTIILACSTVINAILTFSLVPILGTYGAAIGTSFSMIFGYGIALNIYYQKRAKVNLKIYFSETYKGLWLSILLSFIIGMPISYFIKINVVGIRGWMMFALEALAYCIVYALLTYFIGMNATEKKLIPFVKKDKKNSKTGSNNEQNITEQ